MNPSDLVPEAHRTVADRRGDISFMRMDGARGLTGYVRRAALEVHVGADAGAAQRAFDRHLQTIHRLARSLGHRGQPGPPTVVLTVDAVFRVLTGE